MKARCFSGGHDDLHRDTELQGSEADTTQGEELDRLIQCVKAKEITKDLSVDTSSIPLENLLRQGNQLARVRGQKWGIVKTALNNPLNTLKYSNVLRGHIVQKVIHIYLGTKALLKKECEEL